MNEYISHIKDVRTSFMQRKSISFCGKSIEQEFHFEHANHAIVERQSKGRLLPCPDCRKIIIDLLNSEE